MATSGSFVTSGYSDPGYVDHYVFSWNLISQSIEGNYSDISWSLKGAGGQTGGYYTIVYEKYVTVNGSTQSNSSEQTTYNGTTPFSGTTRIYHNSDGKKSFSASAGGAFYYSGSYNSTGSGSWELPDIPRKANITSAQDFTDESNPIIQYSNLAGNNVTSLKACISLTGANADISYRDIPKTGTSYTFNLTEAERNVLRNATKNSKSRTVVFIIQTIIGGNTYTHTSTKKLTIVNANPAFTSTNITYSDTNTTVTNITKNNQNIVQNKSNLAVNYTSAIGAKGATISKYQFILNGVIKESTSESGSINFGTVNSANSIDLTVIVTDSRGNSTTVTKRIIILEYYNPNAIVTLNRLNNYEDETYLTVDGSIASVNSKNTMSIKYRYKVSGGNYNSFTTISDNVKQTLSLNKNNSYIFNVVVTDAFGSTYDKEHVLNKGIFPFFIDTIKNSVGINCFPTQNNSLEVNGNLLVSENNITQSITNLNTSIGNINTDINNINNTISQLSSRTISSGSNSNGSWTKFYDGTMICTMSIEVTDQGVTNAYGSLYQGTRIWVYPVAFLNVPTVSCDMWQCASGASWGTVAEKYSSQCTLRGFDVVQRAVGTITKISATAIGRWK